MINEVLKKKDNITEEINYLKSIGLTQHKDYVKSWDVSKAIKYIMKNVKKHELIYDVGSGAAVILKFLEKLGYSNLIGADPLFEPHKEGNIDYRKDYGENISLENNSVKCITCLSTIEHGLNIDMFLKECDRTLKENGFLIISTDYWSIKIPAALQMWKIFSLEEVCELVDKCKKYNLELIEPINFTLVDPVVMNRYTFIFFILKKRSR